MTTFPTPSPAPERAEHPRNTSHIRAGATPSYPAGPVPIDPTPTVEAEKIPGPATGAPGLAPDPSKT
jgi:hypothetical protein